MSKQNVYGNAKIISEVEAQPFQMGTFSDPKTPVAVPQVKNLDVKYNNPYAGASEEVMSELRQLSATLSQVQKKVDVIQNEGVRAKDLDKQVINAIKDLQQYAKFFEQASFQFETKVLKTSIAIAKKIIAIEVGENSSKIAKQTIENILNKIQKASKISIHLNPKDYVVLKSELQLASFIALFEDPNVMPGGVVIASDLGNFDGNVDAKIATMLESLETIS